ncbi:hypothetical protein R1sor_000764 [Riccia sorocarpa]|uniref:Uncharacterized protein n=1 Tax=Riccia sorocarpa TaxID=122646 RepID=A0ABD3GU17_9MARC
MLIRCGESSIVKLSACGRDCVGMASRADPTCYTRCDCSYMCRRVCPELGYQFVSYRTKQRYLKHDSAGTVASAVVVSREKVRLQQAASQIARVETNDAPNVSRRPTPTNQNFVHKATIWRYNHFTSVQRSFFSSQQTLPDLDLAQDQGFQDNLYSSSRAADRCAGDTSPPITVYQPTLDEAIYRATWRLQFLMDEANVTADTQNSILRCLFDSSQLPTRRSDGILDYSGVSLGTLMWHAGAKWTGGELGMRTLSSLESILNTYCGVGMASVVKWRLCIGVSDTRHAAVPFGESSQDEYIHSREEKCVCLNTPSSGLKRDYDSCSKRCTVEECRLMRKAMIPFDYISMSGLFRNLCNCRTLCEEMLSMWRARDRWIGYDGDLSPSYPIREWWDGTKAKEVAWFFDANSSSPLFARHVTRFTGLILKHAKSFQTKITSILKAKHTSLRVPAADGGLTSSGDPRNLVIMGYWDGFQSSTTVVRNTWIVGIKVLNTGSNGKLPAMPVLFIPNTTDESTNKLDILDAALEPFIRDCIDLFVNGVEVDYAYPTELVDGVSTLSSRFTLRCMLVMFSGDHPAQCKFAGFSTGGFAGCRRCECLSRWRSRPGVGLGGIIEYHGNRKCHRHPPRARCIQELHDSALQIARCETSAQRKEITRRSGVVSKTRAWRLVDGLGLDLSRDLMFDVMHVVALCLFKKYIELLRKDTMDSPQRKSALSRAMADVTTTKPSSITGRWPRDIFTRIGYFKAEECSKFMLYCVPHILHEVGYHPDDALHQLGALLVQIARMFYLLHRSDQGWTTGMLESCRSMLASWRIRSEELLGPNSSILEHVAMAGYNKVKTNSKNMEHTFTSYYARVFFANCMVQKWEDDDGLLPSDRCLRLIHSHMRFSARRTCERTDLAACASWHEDGVCVVTTQNKAKEIWELVARDPASICASQILESGIGVGSKRIRACPLPRRMKVYLTRYWREKEATSKGQEITDISDHIVQLKSLIVRGKIFKPGDHVIVLDESRNDLTYCIRLSVARLTGTGGRLGNWDFISFPYADTGMERISVQAGRGFLFGPSGVRVSPPHPELHDVMLACHADECGSSVLDYCVVRMVFAREDEANASQLPAGTENLLEDIADVTDQTSAEQAGGEVQVQRIRQNGTGSWVMRPGACCSTIPFRHLRKLCDNFTVVAYTGDKPCQWIGG